MFYDSLILNPFGDSLKKRDDILEINLYNVILAELYFFTIEE